MKRPTALQETRDAEIVRCHCGAWRGAGQVECLACQAISARYVPGWEPLR